MRVSVALDDESVIPIFCKQDVQVRRGYAVASDNAHYIHSSRQAERSDADRFPADKKGAPFVGRSSLK